MSNTTTIQKEDIKQMTIYIPKELHKQLKMKALEENTTLSDLVVEYCKEKV